MKIRRIFAILLAAAVVFPSTSLAAGAVSNIDGSGFPYSTIVENLEWNDSAIVSEGLNLDGKVLTINGDLTQVSDIYLAGGTLIVTGEYYLNGGTLCIGGGTLIVGGNMKIGDSIYVNALPDNSDKTGTITVNGNVNQNAGEIHADTGIFEVGGDFIQQSDVYGENGTIHVGGSYHQLKNYLRIQGGTLEIDGDYRLQSTKVAEDGTVTYGSANAGLSMEDKDGYMLVKGDFVTQSAWNGTNNPLTAGTLELQGNFTQLVGNGYRDNFNAKIDHRVVFSGDSQQNIYFESPDQSGFYDLSATPNTLVDIQAARISTIESGVAVNSFVQYGDLDLNGNIITVLSKMTQKGDIHTSGGELIVEGDYLHSAGRLKVENGKVTIGGDYCIRNEKVEDDGTVTYSSANAGLYMEDKDGYMLVKGDFVTQSAWNGNNNPLTAGTLEIQGNFTQLVGNGYRDNFNAREEHKVIFSSDDVQKIFFESPDQSGFHILSDTPEENASIEKGRIHLLTNNVVVNDFVQYGDLDLNGCRLIVKGNMTQFGNIITSGGELIVEGDYLHSAGRLKVENGSITINGSYRIQNKKVEDDGTVTYGSANAGLYMEDKDGYMLVKGDFVTQSAWDGNNNPLTAGTLEIQGDFTQLVGNGYRNNFNAKGDHKVILSGENMQRVYFESPDQSGFCCLEIAKWEYPGVIFATEVVYHTLITYYDLTNLSTVSQQNVLVNTPVTIHAQAIGGSAPYTFAYYYKKSTSSSWTKLSSYTSELSMTFTPAMAADYMVRVWVKDAEGAVAEKIIPINSAKEELSNLSTVSSENVAVGDSVTVTGKAQGGKGPYTYAFYYKKASSKYRTLIGTAYTTDTAKISIGSASDYQIFVIARDSVGREVEKNYLVHGVQPAIVNTSTVSSEKVTAGTAVTLKGSVKGGQAPYTYAYYYKKSTSSSWSRISDFSDKTTASFTPAMAATYQTKIIVKDAAGETAEKVFTITSTKATLTNSSTVSAENVTAGSEVKLFGKASGGSTPYQFAYYYKKSTSSSWTRISDFSNSESAVFVPAVAAQYQVRISVKDKTGSIVHKQFTIVSSKSTMKNLSTVSASTVRPGTKVELNGNASGGTAPYTYAYYYKKSTSAAWNLISDYSAATSAAFTPAVAATYYAKILVKDASGVTASKQLTVVSTTVLILSNTATVSAETVAKGTPVTISGTATGGTAPYTFTYQYKKATSSSWTKLTASDDAGTTAVFTPGMAASYLVRVTVTDKSGQSEVKEFTITSK